LKDTVIDYDAEPSRGTGFVFDRYEPNALWESIERALRVFVDNRLWTALIHRAMGMDSLGIARLKHTATCTSSFYVEEAAKRCNDVCLGNCPRGREGRAALSLDCTPGKTCCTLRGPL